MQKYVDVIRDAQLKATKPRVVILEALSQSRYPRDVETIARKVHPQKIDVVTVYRTLETFEKAGLVRRVDLRRGKTYFEIVDDGADHHHVVCTECGVVKDVTGCEYPTQKKALQKTRGFAKITSHSFEYFGVCSPCARI